MYRSGWGTKQDQEITLAITIRREGFEELLKEAVHSIYIQEVYKTQEEWKHKMENAAVVLQWDPDHNPSGHKQNRRAIQLGIKGELLDKYINKWTVKIEDISDFVEEQRQFIENDEKLITPFEEEYPITDLSIKQKLNIL